MRTFETIGNFTFDVELVKGWFIEDSLGTLEDAVEPVRHCVVLYDCFQIPIPDQNRELETYLTEKFNVSSDSAAKGGTRKPSFQFPE